MYHAAGCTYDNFTACSTYILQAITNQITLGSFQYLEQRKDCFHELEKKPYPKEVLAESKVQQVIGRKMEGYYGI